MHATWPCSRPLIPPPLRIKSVWGKVGRGRTPNLAAKNVNVSHSTVSACLHRRNATANPPSRIKPKHLSLLLFFLHFLYQKAGQNGDVRRTKKKKKSSPTHARSRFRARVGGGKPCKCNPTPVWILLPETKRGV